MRRALSVLAPLGLLFVTSLARAETVKVLVPDRGNLQYTPFWVAHAAGFFEAEGIQIELVTPPGPQQAEAFFEEHKADVAILPPPVYADLIAHDVPVVLVANLLAHDPINLVVRRSIMEERHLDAKMPLKARLEGLHGLKLGVAPHPPTRLRALYASVGLDADKDITQVILHGRDQNAAFESGEVDALYAHTPFVERALVHADAVMLVHQSGGEVPVLANRQIHALGVRRTLLDLREALVAGMVRAIAKAETLARAHPEETARHLATEFPNRDRAELDLIAKLYAPAFPETPKVSAELIPHAVDMYPADKARPDLSKVKLADHVRNVVVFEPPQPTTKEPLGNQRWFQILAAVVGGLVFVVSSAVMRARLSKQQAETPRHD